ncbi:MAG TPA: phosphate ABC transporter permease subunit PstC [Thermoanaerobaculia bacterium]|nr:phosphate ABC transporter permease subunit PstC [Thermoanaerobaculia bacterium]
MSRPRVDTVRLTGAAATAITASALLAVIALLAAQSIPAARQGLLHFVSANDWSYRAATFGAAAMIYGTVVVSAIALLLAAPLSFATAVFLSEICHRRLRMPLKAAIELLAGIPSVVYGLVGVLFLRDLMGAAFERLQWNAWQGDTLLTAGILLAVMIVPTMTTLADDALRSVPARSRDAARALGLTRAESVFSVVVPQARSGLVAAVLLGLGRALGETIAVFLIVGRADNRLPESFAGAMRTLIEPGQTITSKLGGAEPNIAAGDPLHGGAIALLALVLLSLVLLVTLAADRLRTGTFAEEH